MNIWRFPSSDHRPLLGRVRRRVLAARLSLSLMLAIVSLASASLSASAAVNVVNFNLSPNATFLSCFRKAANLTPTAAVTVTRGPGNGGANDTLEIVLNNFKPDLDFDLFTVQNSNLLANGSPNPAFAGFGLAWYQSDIQTDTNGHADVIVKTILLDQIFGFDPDASLTPTATFHLGFWFNNPADAAACGFDVTKPTPFNGEHNAGPLAMISLPNITTGKGPLSTGAVPALVKNAPMRALELQKPAPAVIGPAAVDNSVQFNLAPNGTFLSCMRLNANVTPTAAVTVTRGPLNDTLRIVLNNFKANITFELFTVQRSTFLANGTKDPNFTNFGLAWYQSDIPVDATGHADVTIQTILLDQIFGFDPAASLAPTNTFHVGFWFDTPADAQPCGFDVTHPTPFNGEHAAGPVAMISVPKAVGGLGPLATTPDPDPVGRIVSPGNVHPTVPPAPRSGPTINTTPNQIPIPRP